MEHPSLRDKAYVSIKQKLLHREIQPGERIRKIYSIRQHRAILEGLHQRDVNRSVAAMRTNILGMKCKLGLEGAAQG